ncbi:ABC transporter substrate-binding protein [Roseomonas elaeocarpi]|uniref:ABC transporter substrate-binding protein n=1 Tax=Roseomonas elaeocarpi TaxID=907779 RepID=A0ABV6JP16_9PROT
MRNLLRLSLALVVAVGLVRPGIAADVNFYSSLTSEDNQAIIAGMKETMPDLTVNWVRGGGVGLFQRFVSERSAGAAKIDLLHFSYAPGWYMLADEGWVDTEAAKRPEAAAFYDFAKDPGTGTVALRVSTLRIIYNKDKVKPADLPHSWHDLLDPRWRGRIVAADPFQAAGTWDFFWGAKGFGKDYITALAKNDVLIQSGMPGTVDAVARGERDIGITFEYLAQQRIMQGAPIAFAPTADGVPVVPAPFGIVAGAPHRATAEKVFDFVISAPGQRIMVSRVGSYSGRRDVAPPAGFEPFEHMTLLQADWKRVFEEQDDYRDFMTRTLQNGRG